MCKGCGAEISVAKAIDQLDQCDKCYYHLWGKEKKEKEDNNQTI